MTQFFNFRKLALGLLLTAFVGLGSSLSAKADTFSVSGAGYNATATITQVGNQLTVVLTNNLANQVSVGSSISGFHFDIVGFGGGLGGVVSQTGRAVVFSANHVFNDIGTSAADALGWGITGAGGSFHLNALGVTGPNGTNPPDETIAGVPSSTTATTVTYGSSNSSMENDPHNPIVANSATFVFTVTGLPANATFTNIVFAFGTGPTLVQCVDCGTTTVIPEPASMLLLGTGLIGVAGIVRRRFGKTQ